MTRRPSNPFDEIETFLDRMSKQLEESPWSVGADRPPVDVVDRGDSFVVRADLPGFDRDQIDLTVTERTLRIRAAVDEEADDIEDVEAHRVIRQERRHRSVSRSVRLPEDIDAEGVRARYADGVIEVTIPKSGAEEATEIEIE